MTSSTVVPSKAYNGSAVSPSTIAGIIRDSLTTSTPGVDRSSAASAGLNPDRLSDPPACTTCVPVNSVSIEPASEVFADAAKTVMNPTRATPIVNEAAVRAVRCGLRFGWAGQFTGEPTNPQRETEHRREPAGRAPARYDHSGERRVSCRRRRRQGCCVH